MPRQITNQRDLRRAFWRDHPNSKARYYRIKRTQNDYPADVRTTWCDWIDAMYYDGTISETLAQRATL